MLAAIILVIAVRLATLFLYEPAEILGPSHEIKDEIVGQGVCSLPFLGISLALLLFSCATNGLNTHWAALLTDRGASGTQAALVLSVAGFASLASKLSTGYLLDRLPAGRIAAALVAACALGFILILTGSAQWLSDVSAILVGVGMGAESDADPYLLTRYFGLRRFSELYGYTWCVYAIAGATGRLSYGGCRFNRLCSPSSIRVKK